MKAIKPVGSTDDVVVLVSGLAGGLDECIIRRAGETVRLGGQVYRRYQIIKPRGYEKEEILHPLGRGTAGLLGTVFYALAEGGSRRRKKLSGRGE